MPNKPSAKKRVLRNDRHAAINKSRKGRIRTAVRTLEDALAAGDKTAAASALKAAEPVIMRGVSKGVIHKNTGARKVSRLAARVNRLNG